MGIDILIIFNVRNYKGNVSLHLHRSFSVSLKQCFVPLSVQAFHIIYQNILKYFGHIVNGILILISNYLLLIYRNSADF